MHSFSSPYSSFSSFFISFHPTPNWVHGLSCAHSLWWGKSLLDFLTGFQKFETRQTETKCLCQKRGFGMGRGLMGGTSFHCQLQRDFVWMEGGEGKEGYCISFPAYLSGRKQARRAKGCWDICADVNRSSQIKISKPKAGVQTETVELPDIKGLASFHLSEKGTQGAIYTHPPQCFTTLHLDNSREHLINTPSTKNEKVSFLPAR